MFLVSHVESNEFETEYESQSVSFKDLAKDLRDEYLDVAYAPSEHAHEIYFEKSLSGSFSLSSHDHDGRYSQTGHKHTVSEITDYEKPDVGTKAYRKTKIVSGQTWDLTMQNDLPVVYFTNLNCAEYDFGGLDVSEDLEDGVYTWEVICRSDNDVSNVTVGDSGNVKYVGTDLENGMVDGEKFAAGTTVVFAVRLLKTGDSKVWNVNYCYKF